MNLAQIGSAASAQTIARASPGEPESRGPTVSVRPRAVSYAPFVSPAARASRSSVTRSSEGPSGLPAESASAATPRSAAAGLPGAGVYCATKAFLSGLARAAHNEYAGRGVRVHLAHPGLMRTPRTAAVADRFAAAHAIAVGDVEDIAGRLVTLFLSADAACVEVNL